MKLFIELEIGPDEIPLATELFRTLRLLTEHVKTRDIRKLFQMLITRLEDGTQLDTIAPQIATLLIDNSSESVFDDFFGAFMDVVFNRDLVIRQQSVMPFMLLLSRLPEPAKTKMRDALIPKVLKHLTIKRQMDANRMDFFSHAEAFAGLVDLEFVSITGAISTIITLLWKPENRCAAVTMLGKTVEVCLQQITDKCDPTKLADLRVSLQNIHEENFQYDINYIEESMGWSHQPGNGQHGATVLSSIPSHGDANKLVVETTSTGYGLYAVESYRGHCNTIFAMAYDEKRNQIISGGKDGTLIIWTSDGQIVENLDMARHYACSMDIHPSLHTLLICGVAKEDADSSGGSWCFPPPCIFCYSPVGCGWNEQGILLKDSSKLISCIKALEGTDHAFITGESVPCLGTISRADELVCYYDLQSAMSFASIEPLKKYAAHEELITCLSSFPPDPSVFMSGSRDTTIRVWDRRTDRSIGVFGKIGKTGLIHAHDGMVTCIDALNTNMILSAGMDTKVNCWDLRSLGSQGGNAPIATLSLDGSAILKVALGGAPSTAAVSTLLGLYIVDFSSTQPVPQLAVPFQDGRRIGRYHDLKWGERRSVLYAAGDDMRIDFYAFR